MVPRRCALVGISSGDVPKPVPAVIPAPEVVLRHPLDGVGDLGDLATAKRGLAQESLRLVRERQRVREELLPHFSGNAHGCSFLVWFDDCQRYDAGSGFAKCQMALGVSGVRSTTAPDAASASSTALARTAG